METPPTYKMSGDAPYQLSEALLLPPKGMLEQEGQKPLLSLKNDKNICRPADGCLSGSSPYRLAALIRSFFAYIKRNYYVYYIEFRLIF